MAMIQSSSPEPASARSLRKKTLFGDAMEAIGYLVESIRIRYWVDAPPRHPYPSAIFVWTGAFPSKPERNANRHPPCCQLVSHTLLGDVNRIEIGESHDGY